MSSRVRLSGIVVLAIAATLVAGGGILAALGTTAASFTDRVIETATMGAGTLPAPQSLSAAPDGVAVDLAWTPAAGDFADEYEVFRVAGVCPGTLGYLDSVAAPATAYEDTAVTPGNTYCYAVRGTAGADWTSSFSNTAQVSLPFPETRLYLHTGPVLRTTAGTGSYSFGCTLLGVGGLCILGPPEERIYTSSGTYNVLSNAGWEASLALNTGLSVIVTGTVTVTADLWYAPSCGALPPAGSPSRIASGSFTVNLPGVALSTISGVHPITMTGNPGFVAPSSAQTLCMRVHSSHPALLTLTATYNLNHGTDTWVEGPFLP